MNLIAETICSKCNKTYYGKLCTDCDDHCPANNKTWNEKLYDRKPESFFSIFSYAFVETEGGDKTICYEIITITRDIPELGLVKGKVFDSCYWNVDECKFIFFSLEPFELGGKEVERIEVNQVKLAKYMCWWDSDCK